MSPSTTKTAPTMSPRWASHEIREAGAVSYLCHPIGTYDGTYYDGEEEHDGREEEAFRCF